MATFLPFSPVPPRQAASCLNSFYPCAVDMMSVKATADLRLKPKFFQVLMPGFSHKLDIPIAFHKHIVPEEIATICSTVGTWLIKIQGTAPNLYFGEGWPQFASAHDLNIGYFLVFCLEGGLNFSVVVLDGTSCGMEFWHPQVDGNVLHKEIRSLGEEEKHLECVENETKCRKKRKKESVRTAKVATGVIKEEEVNDEVAKGTKQHKGIMTENIELGDHIEMGSKVNKKVIKRRKGAVRESVKEKKRNKERTSESPGVEWRLNSRIRDFEGSGKVYSRRKLYNREDRILGNHLEAKDSQDHLTDGEKHNRSPVQEIDVSLLDEGVEEMDTRREVKRREDIGVKCCNSKSTTRYCEEHILVYARRKRIKECSTLENDVLLEVKRKRMFCLKSRGVQEIDVSLLDEGVEEMDTRREVKRREDIGVKCCNSKFTARYCKEHILVYARRKRTKECLTLENDALLEVKRKTMFCLKSRGVQEIDVSLLDEGVEEMDTRREVKRREDIGVKCCNSKSTARYCKEHILVYARRKRTKECLTLENDALLEVKRKTMFCLKSRGVQEIDISLLDEGVEEMDTRREVKRREDIGVKCCNSKSTTRYCEEHILVYARKKRRIIKECMTLENDVLLEDPEVLMRNKMKANKSGIVRERKNTFEKRDKKDKRKTERRGSANILRQRRSYKKVGANNANRVNNIAKENSKKNTRNGGSKIYVNYGLRNRKVYKESICSDGATSDTCTEKAPPKYRVTLKPRNLDGHYYIYIPVQFKEHTGISIRDKLLLKDPKGDIWPVDVLHSTKNRTLLMKGWKEFCLSNYLRPGDDCEFQLDPESKENMKVVEVSILKKSKKQRVEALKVRRTCGSNISGTPMFWHTFTPGSEKTSLLQIPNAFAASIGILETRRVMLSYMNGDPFTVNLARGCRKRAFLSAGWREFCKINDLKHGDTCEFRLESGSEGTPPLFRVKKLEEPPNAS